MAPEAPRTPGQVARLVRKVDGPRFGALVKSLVEPYRDAASRIARLQGAAIDEEWIARRLRAVLLRHLYGTDTSWPAVARRHGIRGISEVAVNQLRAELEEVLSSERYGVWPRHARRPVRDVRGCLAYVDGSAATRDAAGQRRQAQRTETWGRRRKDTPSSDGPTPAMRALAQFSTGARKRYAKKRAADVAERLRRGDSVNKIAKDLRVSYHYVERLALKGPSDRDLDLMSLLWGSVPRRFRDFLPDDTLPEDPMLYEFVAALVRRHYVSKEALAHALGTSPRTLGRYLSRTPLFRGALKERPPPPEKARPTEPAASMPRRPGPGARLDDRTRIDLHWMRPYRVSPALARMWESAGFSANEGGPWAAEGFLPEHRRWLNEHFPGTGPVAARKSLHRGFTLPTGKKLTIRGYSIEERKAVVLPEELPPLWAR